MRDVVIDYEPRPLQLEIHKQMRTHRYGVLVCHRRFGKTVLAVNHLQRCALTTKGPPNAPPRFGYISPTYKQGKATAFDYMQHYARDVPGVKVNQSELKIDYPNGGQVRVYGADSPDSLRGLYFDGIVLDEYGLFPPRAFSEVLAPTLIDRQGWALFMGTPKGRNEFYEQVKKAKEQIAEGNSDWFYAEYKVSQTDLFTKEQLDAERLNMTPDEYAQEYECSFEAAIKGAIYAKELEAARSDGRVGVVPYDPALPVDTDWDLGVGDAMAIWFSQSTRSGEVRLIDYYEASGEGFPFYIKLLADKGYAYGKHWAPHDIVVREFSSGRSRQEVALSQGIKFEITPRLHTNVGGEVEEGIHAARMLFPRCWVDAVKCKAGLEALQHYRRDYNERLNEFKATPVHDWASHAADAFRGLAVRHQVPMEKKKRRAAQVAREYNWA